MTGATDRYGVQMPPVVRRAIALAERLGFPLMPEGRPFGHEGPPSACIPEMGRLLAALAASRPGGRIAEHGTGVGVGAAWLLSGMTGDSTLVSVELDPGLARAAAELFADHPNVRILPGDCTVVLAAEPPFDLVFMDAGAREMLDPERWDEFVETVRVGGMIVFDDLKPVEQWPPEWDDLVDRKRELAYHNSRVIGAEVRTTATEVALIVTRVR